MKPRYRPRVKVCGLTRAADVIGLQKMQVDYFGFNLCRNSKRYLEPEKAKSLISLAGIDKSVAVFQNSPLDMVIEISQWIGVGWVQLHGNEDLDYIANLPFPVIKAYSSEEIHAIPSQLPLNLRFLLIDSRSGGRFGGTGVAFDWRLLRGKNFPRPLFLAGGLGPANLVKALESYRPYGVDLNSKVESMPGIKEMSLVDQSLKVMNP